VRASLAFAVGVAAGLGLGAASTEFVGAAFLWPAVTVVAVSLGLAARAFVRPGPRAARPILRQGRAVIGALLAAGVAHGAGAARSNAVHPLALLPDGSRVRVAGTLEARPGPDGAGWLVADSARAAGAAGPWRPLRGRVRVRLPRSGGRDLALAVEGVWRRHAPRAGLPPRPARAGWIEVTEAAPLGQAGSLAPRLRARAQDRLRAWLGARAPAAEAMVLARRETLDRGARERFAAAGLSHLLAISGLHVAVVAAAILTTASVARLPRGLAAPGAGAGVLGYTALLGFPHAATRAATQICLVLGARVLQRPSDPFALLAAAGILLLAGDPLALAEPGFQMSFAGVAGLVAWHGPLARRLACVRVRAARDAAAASVAATVATAPIAAWTFGQAAPVGLVANLVAIPIAGLAVPAIGAALAVGMAWPPAGELLGGGAAALLAALDATAAGAARVPGGHFPVARPGFAAILGAAGAVAVARGLLRARRRPVGRRARRLVTVGAASFAALAAAPAFGALAPPVLELHVIDVGQGDALGIRTPRGRWLLVDAGPRSTTFDAGRALVVPYLLRQGAWELEALLLTHPDGDHIGGAEAVLSALEPDFVLDPAAATGKGQYVEALRAAAGSGGRWLRAEAGAELLLDGVRLSVLAPDSASLAASSEANDISVVARLDFGEFRALLMGDAPAEVEHRLVARDPAALRAAVLKVGHHGSHTSTSPELLGAVGPAYALIPVGRRNRYGHPHPEVVGRLESAGVTVLRTDRDGSIVLRARRDGSARVRRPAAAGRGR